MDAAFFDIDNTLAHRDSATGEGAAVSRAVAEALSAFCAAGNLAFVSTGRAPQGVPASVASLPLSGMVCFDGSYAELDGTPVWERFIETGDLASALDEACRTHIGLLFSGMDGRAFAGDARGYDWHATEVSSMEELARAVPGMRIGKLAFRYYDLERYEASDVLRERFACFRSAPDYYELVCPGVGKDVAARAVLDALAQRGEAPERVLAFGDSANDLALLRMADIAVAMGNASDEVQAAAALVTDDVAHDGVATALARLGYCGSCASSQDMRRRS